MQFTFHLLQSSIFYGAAALSRQISQGLRTNSPENHT